MAVPSTFADLSATPASNSGLIADSSAVNVIDDHFRTVYALIASIYANSGNGWASPWLTVAAPIWTGNLTTVSGNLGIGASSPGAKLEISGSGNAAEARLRSTDTTPAIVRAYVNSTEVGKLAFENGGALSVETLGTERLRLDASGNLTVKNTNSAPSTPTGGGVLYVESGALKYRGSSGTITTLGAA
jgi:hypothetical protein